MPFASAVSQDVARILKRERCSVATLLSQVLRLEAEVFELCVLATR